MPSKLHNFGQYLVNDSFFVFFQSGHFQGTKGHVEVTCFLCSKFIFICSRLKFFYSDAAFCRCILPEKCAICWSVGMFLCISMCVVARLYITSVRHPLEIFVLYLPFVLSEVTKYIVVQISLHKVLCWAFTILLLWQMQTIVANVFIFYSLHSVRLHFVL